MLEHGGRLAAAAQAYNIPLADWLDLSTGINPHGWPVPDMPPEVWRRLPEDSDGLTAAASAYYSTDCTPLPAAGSQPLIQALPRLRSPCRVAMLTPAYAEHAYAWQRCGHQVISTPADDLAQEKLSEEARRADVLLLCNPNNPTGHVFPPSLLLEWLDALAARGGWLVVDEAFMDATPGGSLASHAGRSGLVVLCSLGKFFGLAGARVGFALTWDALRADLEEEIGPWPIGGPARWAALHALCDTAWQAGMRKRLSAESQRLAALLSTHHLQPAGGSALFQWCPTTEAEAVAATLARQGILVRLFTQPHSLRFGLPGSEAEWQRLETALIHIGKSAP
ncbi:MAG: threonine-phosphate decarboxylase [Nitrosomonadales bacterium]|nr:MAG: threonine-phosphate decarboxylase [Nitrosomonadales bacterium]